MKGRPAAASRAPLDFFRDLSISRKFFGCLIVFILLPLLIAAVFINSRTSGVITAKTNESIFQSLKQTQYNLEAMIKDADYLSTTIFSDDNMQNLIQFYSSNSFVDFEQTKSKLISGWGGSTFQNLLDSRDYISSISISRNKDVIFQIGDTVSMEDDRFYPQANALKGRIFWTPVYELNKRYKQTPSIWVISLIRVVNSLDSFKQIAMERISIDEAKLAGYYAGVNEGKGGQIFIVDSQGAVLSSPDKSLLGRHPKNERSMQAIYSGKEGSFTATVNHVRAKVFYYTLSETGWKVVQIIPAKELSKQIHAMNLFIFLCIVVVLLFGTIFSIIQHRSVVLPLKRLSQEMGKVKNGTFNVRLKVASKDEIGRVGFIFINMIKQIEQLIEHVYKGQIREKEAELKALQAQINPHFLYNTLDSIRWLAVKNKDYAVSGQIEALADMFRHVLNKGEELTTVQEEVEHIRNYMMIQNNRFGDKVKFELLMDSYLADVKIPNLIVQPLIENAIFHGIEPKINGGKISLTIERTGEELRLTVEDDGVGMDKARQAQLLSKEEELSGGFALKNIHERLLLHYGERYGLRIESKLGQGTKVSLTIPIEQTGGTPDEIVDRG